MDIYYYRHNSFIIQGASAIIFLCCFFWAGWDKMNDDIYGYIQYKAIYWIAAMAVTALISFVYSYFVTKRMDMWELAPEKHSLEISLYRLWMVLFFSFLFLTVSMINCAEAASIANMEGQHKSNEISLASTLLIIPAFAAMPKKADSAALLCACIITLLLPIRIVGIETYPILQEGLFRLAVIIAYIIIRNQLKNNYEEHMQVENGKNNLMRINEKTMDVFVGLIEARDETSGRHVDNIKKYTKVIATTVANQCSHYNLTEEDINVITRASAFHDIGKIYIPDRILCKKGNLTDDEIEEMKQHTRYGYEILQQIPEEIIEKKQAAKYFEIALYHHEKVDGKGYPSGLKEGQIPISAQIVALADCYEALTHSRPYKDPLPPEVAIKMIKDGECGAFSNEMLNCLDLCSRELIATGT